MRIFLLSFVFIFPLTASAANYYWTYWAIGGQYSSPQAVCEAAGGGPGYSVSYEMLSGGTSAVCVVTRQSDGYVDRGAFVNRSGDSCAVDTTYNPQTGVCVATQKDGDICTDQTGARGPGDPMIYSSKAGKCVNFTQSDDAATCGYLAGKGGAGTSYTVAGTWDGGTPSAPPVFVQDGLSCEVATVSTSDCVAKGTSGAVQCNVIGKLTGNVSNKTNVTDAKDASCPDGKCVSLTPETKTENQPCVYSGSGSSVSCTSNTNTTKDGTQQCGSVNGAVTCITVPPTSNGIKIDSTVKTSSNSDGSSTSVKTDNATKTVCTGINKCTSTSSTTTTTTHTNSSGQPTSTNTSCTGTCSSSGTGITGGTPSGTGTGDSSSGNCTSEDCGSGGAGGLTDPQNGNFDGQSAEWDKKIADGKDDLKDRLNKLKTAFTPLGDAKLGEGGGKLYCPPPVEFYGRDIDFCLDKFAGSLSWIAAAVYAVCAIAALFIVFL